MGNPESGAGTGNDIGGTTIHSKIVVAKNTGKCVEDSYPDGAIKLHLGSGRLHWDGWINVDFDERADIQCDLKKLPFPSDYADVACSVHVIEHFYEWEAKDVLKEWYRIIKPGGSLILECPSMDKVFHYIKDRLVRGQTVDNFMSWFPLWGDPKYQSVAMTHKWGYTFHMLKNVLNNTGFTDVELHEARYHFPKRDMRLTAVKPSTT